MSVWSCIFMSVWSCNTIFICLCDLVYSCLNDLVYSCLYDRVYLCMLYVRINNRVVICLNDRASFIVLYACWFYLEKNMYFFNAYYLLIFHDFLKIHKAKMKIMCVSFFPSLAIIYVTILFEINNITNKHTCISLWPNKRQILQLYI